MLAAMRQLKPVSLMPAVGVMVIAALGVGCGEGKQGT